MSDHPDICTALVKETHFFDQDIYFHDGFFSDKESAYEWYHMFFNDHVGQRVTGEATPTYMYAPHIAERLKDYNPELKLIFLLRNPVERAYSHYRMMERAKKESLTFSEALCREESRLQEAQGNYGVGSPMWLYSYASRGFYMAQIRNMLRYFPRELMLFLRSEDLLRNRRETLARVYEFLEVEPQPLPESKGTFAGEYEPMRPQDRAYLLDLYSREIDALEAFLGWDLGDWRE